MAKIENPLAQYFRTPGVHQKIPSGGRFLTPGTFTTAINGEFAVLPMTAQDELFLKNPDSLLNGEALEKLFHSCVPGIKNPREISVPDMDVLLLAIKAASYGDELEMDIKCPKCEKEFETSTSITGLLADMKVIHDDDVILRINDDMVLYLRPYDYQSKVILDMATFEETKLYQHLVDLGMDDYEKQKHFNESFMKISSLNLDLLARCITKVVVPVGEVTDQEFIKEFVANAENKIIKKVTEKVKVLGESGIRKEMEVKCSNEECGHEWTTALIFDPSHFFA